MSRAHFEEKNWTSMEALALLFVILLTSIVLVSGLSIRSLWGPEGRWALIIREMIQHGSYHLPIANGVVDFDKPLLGYWAAVPFARLYGVNEFAIRLPSVIAGVGVVSLVFCLGRRLFGPLQGLLAATFLLSSSLFVFWSRTASPELLNMLAIWLMFWAFVAGAWRGRMPYLLIFYATGGLGAFLKGPVAPAVAITSICVFSLWQAVKEMHADKAHKRKILFSWFPWIFSRAGVTAAAFGLVLFAALLVMPVLVTGSWASVSLMWKENMIRFFSPFDHVDPPYVYPLFIAEFFAPWTFFLMAVLWEKRKGTSDTGERWLLLTALGIFMFFTVSGSRRSYYILPILPALALITGNAVIEWAHRRKSFSSVITLAATVTTCLMILAGLGLFLLYQQSTDYRHPSELVLGAAIVAAGLGALRCFLKRSGAAGLTILVTLVLALNTWGFTKGTALAEKKRTLISFAQRVTQELGGSVSGKVCLYQQGTASLIFYLNSPTPLPECTAPEQCETFRRKAGGSHVIADMNEVKDPEMLRYLRRMQPRAEQAGQPGDGEHFVLFALTQENQRGAERDRSNTR